MFSLPLCQYHATLVQGSGAGFFFYLYVKKILRKEMQTVDKNVVVTADGIYCNYKLESINRNKYEYERTLIRATSV